MAGKNDAAPIVIKRKKVVAGGGHHGGAWKVAYADFVTAMMAFFLLMWLLGATNDKQRKGVADYFKPTVSISRNSAGGDGMFGGETRFADDADTQSGNGVDAGKPGETEDKAALEAEQHAAISEALTAFGGESATMENALRHVVSRVTEEGLVIEFFDLEGEPLFRDDTAEATQVARDVVSLLADVLQMSTNQVSVVGHVRGYPVMLRDNPVWPLSMSRAQTIRQMLVDSGFPADRLEKVVAHADRSPVTADPTAIRNNRIEVILLRHDR